MTSGGPRRFVRQPRVGPGAAQNGPGGPRAPQKKRNRAFREAQGGPRELQEGPKSRPDNPGWPRLLRKTAKMAPKASKIAQEGRQEGPARLQGGAGRAGGTYTLYGPRLPPRTAQGSSKKAQKAAQTALDGPDCCPKRAEMAPKAPKIAHEGPGSSRGGGRLRAPRGDVKRAP